MLSSLLKYIVVILLILITACSTNKIGSVPSDFSFVMDTRTAETGTANHIHIQIDAQGEGRYEVYDTAGIIPYDEDQIVTYDANQVVRDGKFNLDKSELRRLWGAIDENQFFALSNDYRMAIGHSYAFLLIQADGRQHKVDNIGMEVPQIRALVEATDALLPEEVDLDYGEGFIP